MSEPAMNRAATDSTHRLLHAAAVRDARGVSAAPGAVLTRGDRVVHCGSFARVEAYCERQGISPSIEERWRSHLLMPALVNAHAHLDLTHAPATAYRGDFTAWLEHVISHRTEDPVCVTQAVRHGLELSRAAGVGVVGDVAASRTAVEARMAAEAETASGSPDEQRGVSFLECFGIGAGGVERLRETASVLLDVEPASGVGLGLSPHAPYSVSPEAYDAAAEFARRHGLPLQTHAAETAEEVEFTRNATGAFAAMLQRLGRWESHTKGTGQHPIDLLADRLSPPASLVHCNEAGKFHDQVLAEAGLAVVYCPRASAFFGHRGHRYREMLDAGVRVALGTDSILCHDVRDASALSILEEMRLLHRRDGTRPERLLAMATLHGMTALGLDPNHATLAEGAPARFTAAPLANHAHDPLADVLASDAAAELVEPASL